MSIKERLKSWVVWTDILAAVFIILNHTGVLAHIGITANEWGILVDAVGSLLIAFGVLNNPTDRDHF